MPALALIFMLQGMYRAFNPKRQPTLVTRSKLEQEDA